MNPDIYHSNLVVQQPDGTAKQYPNGRFMVQGNQLHYLEDNHGLLAQHLPEGLIDEVTEQRFKNPHPQLAFASRQDISNGHRLDMLPEAKLDKVLPEQPHEEEVKEQTRKPSVWHYQREGMSKPHLLESHEGGFALDGNKLTYDEVKTILGNIHKGVASIRYKAQLEKSVNSMEEVFESLQKAEEEIDPSEALAHLSTMHGNDPKSQAAIKSLRRHIYVDPMTNLGNRYAFNEFMKQNKKPGIHAVLDMNSLKYINDTFGHEAGDSLIRALGGAISSSVDPKTTKAHRFGGDEAHLHFPDKETAYTTLRKIRESVDKIPPIHGVAKPSFSVGLGHDFETADKALYKAKAQKYHKMEGGPTQLKYPPHDTPHLAYSLIPGSEGHVPLDKPHVEIPEKPKLPMPSQPSVV